MKSLKPFWCYYGAKWRAAPRYPSPQYSEIVEPFAGAAGYSLRYPHLSVSLYDLDPIICGVWDYLLKVTPEEVLRLPLQFNSTDELAIPIEAKHLIGFWLNKGVSSPRKSPSAWMRQRIRPNSFWGETIRTRIAEQVPRIKHWTIHQGSYETVLNRSATWFIDPPYQKGGEQYRYPFKDYSALATWCQARQGQVIVCENGFADWLPFKSLGNIKTTSGKSSEVIFYRN